MSLNIILYPSNFGEKGGIMAILKVIEVLGASGESWEHAAKVAIEEASMTIKNIKSIYIQDFSAKVEDDIIIEYRVNAKISFLLENRD